MRTSLFLFVLCAANLMALAAPSAGFATQNSTSGNEKTYTITIKDFEFSPKNLEIPAGSKVVWVNKDDEPHKVLEVNKAFTSQALDSNDSFSFEFRTPGKFEYYCTLHPRMTGKIVVHEK